MNDFLQNFVFRLASGKSKNQQSEVLPNQITETWFEEWVSTSADIRMKKIVLDPATNLKKIIILYCEGMTDGNLLNELVFKKLDQRLNEHINTEDLKGVFAQTANWKLIEQPNQIIQGILTGNTILFLPNENTFYSIDTASVPKRKPEESNTEISIKGPRDGFTEEVMTNVALIRKRLVTQSLCHESFTVGRRSQTKVSMLYIRDIARQDLITEARNRINRMNIDALTSSAQLEESLGDNPRSIFPLIDYIGRPDYAAECLMRGRFVILVNGSPMALIAPVNLTEILKTPEDAYTPYFLLWIERYLRLLGLLIALFLPGFYIALNSYETDQLPFPMLATITNSRFGIPLTVPFEVMIMLVMFELFREAGLRLPKPIGQTVTVVGGLIIGDAAVRAGLTSATLLVVASITAIASFSIINQSLVAAVIFFRIIIILLSTILGMFGFFIGMIGTLAYISTLSSFNVPYLSPISPIIWKEVFRSLFAVPKQDYKQRPEELHPIDSTRQERDAT